MAVRFLMLVWVCFCLVFLPACDSATQMEEPGPIDDPQEDSVTFDIDLYPSEVEQGVVIGDVFFLDQTRLFDIPSEALIYPSGGYVIREGYHRMFRRFDAAGNQVSQEMVLPACENCLYVCEALHQRFSCFSQDRSSNEVLGVFQVNQEATLIKATPFSTQGAGFRIQPTLDGGMVLYTRDNVLIKINADGYEEWQYRLPSAAYVYESIVGFMASISDGFLVAFELDQKAQLLKLSTTGTEIWSKALDMGWAAGIVAVDDGYIIGGERVLRVDKDGNILWDADETWGEYRRQELLYVQHKDGVTEMALQIDHGVYATVQVDAAGAVLKNYQWPLSLLHSTRPPQRTAHTLCSLQDVVTNEAKGVSVLLSCNDAGFNSGYLTGDFWTEMQKLK